MFPVLVVSVQFCCTDFFPPWLAMFGFAPENQSSVNNIMSVDGRAGECDTACAARSLVPAAAWLHAV